MPTKIEQIASSISKLLKDDENISFLSSFELPSPVSIRINPKKIKSDPDLPKIPWNENGYYLPERPVFTLDPSIHAGAYYVQEPGSMFIAQILKQIKRKEHTNLFDLCAAPGGKSTLMSDFLSETDLLIANEINRSRIGALKENCIKWGNPNIIITNNEARDFKKLEHFFDIILVDAPCSGEGMIRKDPQALQEWSEENVQKCCERQQSILDSIWGSLKPGGILIYSTCTFNTAENEDQVKYLQESYAAENVVLQVLPQWNIVTTETKGIKSYRFFPHKLSSEGFFVSVLRKPESDELPTKELKIKYPSKNILADKIYYEISPWIKNSDEFKFLVEKNEIKVIRNSIFDRYEKIKEVLNIYHYGCTIAEIKGEDLIPAHDLALNTILNRENFKLIALEKNQALKYLKRDTLKLTAESGWNLICFEDLPLGWIKQIENRSNNYYPKEWRILMKIPN